MISIRPRFAGAVMNGIKTVELRAHTVNACPGDNVWLYTTRPAAEIALRAVVQRVQTGRPRTIWNLYRRESGISWEEYVDYVDGRSCVTALLLSQVRALQIPMTLAMLRAVHPRFHPPQGVARLREGDPLLDYLKAGSVKVIPGGE